MEQWEKKTIPHTSKLPKGGCFNSTPLHERLSLYVRQHAPFSTLTAELHSNRMKGWAHLLLMFECAAVCAEALAIA